MAPLPVIGNCVRIGLPWSTALPVKPYNVFHVITAQDDLEQLAADIGQAMDDAGSDMWRALAVDYTLPNIDVTPLDGTSATQRLSTQQTITGASTGQVIPNTAMIVSFRTPQRGSRGRGRLYVGPVCESAVQNGQLESPSAVFAAWSDFEDSLASSSSAASLGVASYTHAEVNGVTSIVIQDVLGTQRRRQNQLR